jgi:uncharacterized BrkB/YihY/UPF0761 family membrane protein
MPPISIVSLATPLYAIYTELTSLYKIYGNSIFLNVIFDYDDQVKKPNKPLGFAKEQVAHMVETIYDKLLEFEQERIDLKQKYQREVRSSLLSLIAFIIIISLCFGGAAVALLIKFIKNDKVSEGWKLEYLVWLLVVLVTLGIFISLGVSSFRYTCIKAKMKYASDFGGYPSPLNTLMQNLMGRAVTEELADENITIENTLLPYFYCHAKDCKPNRDQTNYMTIGLLGWYLVRKNRLTDLKLWNLVQKDTVARFDAKEPYEMVSLWRMFSPHFEPNAGFHPIRLLRAIQQLDPAFQSNSLRTSVKRIAEFMHRDNDKEMLNENVIVGKTLQEKFVDVLGVPLLYSSSFVVHRKSLSQAFIDHTIANRMDCIIKAIKNPQYVAAYWGEGKAYFFKTMPIFCFIDKKDEGVGCVIKASIGSKCLVGLGMYNETTLPEVLVKNANVLQNSLLKDPPIDSFAIDKSDKTHGTRYNVWSPVPGLKNVIDVWGILRGASADMKNDVTVKDLQNNTVAFIVLDSLKFVGEYSYRVTGAVGTYIEIGRKYYIRTCVSLFEDIDPNLSIKIDERFVSDLVNAFLMQPGGRARKAIEKDIMSILQDAKENVTPMVSSQRVSLKYIDLSRFSEKLMNLTEKQFLTSLLRDYMNTYAAAVGLNRLQRATDIRKHDIDYKENTLLTVFVWLLICIILICVALTFTFWKDLAPKFQGVIDWNAILDNTWTVIISGIVLRSALMLTFIWVYKNRTRITGDFEKKVCADKAAQVIESSIDIYNCLFINSISTGDTRIFSENTPKLNLSAENIINVFDKLEQNIYASPDRKIDISGVNIKKLWIATINLLEGVEGCNDLLQGFNQPAPFPLFEVSLWILVIIVSLVVIIALYYYIRPEKNLQNIKLYKRMLAEGKTINIDTHIPLSDAKTNTILRYSAHITLPIFIIGFCVLLVSSTNSLQQSLYSNITPMIPVPP